MRETVSIIVKEVRRFENAGVTTVDYNIEWYGVDLRPEIFFARLLISSSNFTALGVFKGTEEIKRISVDLDNVDNEIRAVVRRYADTH